MDRGKRSADWTATVGEKKTKKPCCACDPPSTTGSGTVPEISFLLSSLSVAKRHRPPAADDHHHALKRPRYHHHHDALAQLLHTRMRGLEICSDETDMEGTGNSIRRPRRRDWSSFTPDMLRLICGRLPLADVPRFAAACRHWSLCAFPVYPADTAPVLLSTVVTGAGSSVRCYHPCLHKMFVVATPPQTRLPQGSRVFSVAADGRLMLRTPRKTILFAPLLDDDGGSVLETPQREDDKGFMCCPQQGDDSRKIFAVYPELDAIKIQSWDGGSWMSFHNGGTFQMSFSCNPVMHRGELYCLGQEGNLGVYDPSKTKWRVFPKPASFGSEFQYKNCFLVESQGELLAALTGNSGMPIHVLRLNENKMKWQRMESLGGRSLFTGTTSSLSVARPPQSMANKVFLPRFYGRPQVIHAELASSGGRLFFVAKDEMPEKDENGGGAWCYDLESDSHRPFAGASCKNVLQHVWVHLGRVASPRNDLMVIG